MGVRSDASSSIPFIPEEPWDPGYISSGCEVGRKKPDEFAQRSAATPPETAPARAISR